MKITHKTYNQSRVWKKEIQNAYTERADTQEGSQSCNIATYSSSYPSYGLVERGSIIS